MAENKNMALNDEAMAQASGGKLEPGQEGATITRIVTADPYPDDSIYGSVWEDAKTNGYCVYEINGGRFVVADHHLPGFNTGDEVIVNRIRGYYGWEIIQLTMR